MWCRDNLKVLTKLCLQVWTCIAAIWRLQVQPSGIFHTYLYRCHPAVGRSQGSMSKSSHQWYSYTDPAHSHWHPGPDIHQHLDKERAALFRNQLQEVILNCFFPQSLMKQFQGFSELFQARCIKGKVPGLPLHQKVLIFLQCLINDSHRSMAGELFKLSESIFQKLTGGTSSFWPQTLHDYSTPYIM